VIQKNIPSSARDRAHDEEWFRAFRDRVGQRRVQRIVRYVFTTDEESDHRPAFQRAMIANRATEHRILRLERVEDGLRRRATVEIQLHFVAHARQGAEMMRENDANHAESSKLQHPSSRETPNIKLQVS